MTTTIDTRDVQVIAVQFSKDSPNIRFESFPRRIVYGGREYILADS